MPSLPLPLLLTFIVTDLLMPQPLCPCCSGKTFAKCCRPFLDGQPAPTAEALMRSRYCAYQQNNTDYLLATTHPGQQAQVKQQGMYRHDSDWCRLEITTTEAGSATDQHGLVEFRAWYRDCEGLEKVHHEHSAFAKVDGRWYFVFAGIPLTNTATVGRNDPCPCNSGKKYKKCCG